MSGERARRTPPPSQLVDAAGWVWRALILAAGAWLLLQAAKRLYLITLPFSAGILLAALAFPIVALLRRHRVPQALAALTAGLAGLAVVGGIGTWVVYQIVGQGPSLLASAENALSDLSISNQQISRVRDNVISALQQQAENLAGPAWTGLVSVAEGLAGVLIAVFVCLYLLARGDTVWRWVVGLLPRRVRPSVRQTGPVIWHTLGGWMRGTALVAMFHGTVVAVTAFLMGLPLAVPLGALVFLGSFIPIVGGLIFGGFAVLVAFASNGWSAAVILLGVLLGLNQFEAHVLQPFLIGRYVELNALAVVAALTAGSLLWGVAGAVLAVPLTAAVHAGLKARPRPKASEDDGQPAPPDDGVERRPDGVPEP